MRHRPRQTLTTAAAILTTAWNNAYKDIHAVARQRRRPEPPEYAQWQLYPRLYHRRSDIPAVMHVDYSARVQTVHRETNRRYWQLLGAFQALTGYGLLVNISFNVRGEPIVCTPGEACRCFMQTDMDYLVIGNFLLEKQQQAPNPKPGGPSRQCWISQGWFAIRAPGSLCMI